MPRSRGKKITSGTSKRYRDSGLITGRRRTEGRAFLAATSTNVGTVGRARSFRNVVIDSAFDG
jgi:hypothetical protein